jgi:hypothetical protein
MFSSRLIVYRHSVISSKIKGWQFPDIHVDATNIATTDKPTILSFA